MARCTQAELVVPNANDGELGRTELFGSAASRPALVRFSRSLGLPRPLPDLLGMSVRVLDVYGAGLHQDFLMVTSVDAPVAPSPVRARRATSSSGPTARHFPTGRATGPSSSAPFPAPDSPRFEDGNELERLAAAAATGELVFDLAVAEVWGRFRPVAELRVGDPLPPEADALRFNPWNTGGGLELTGFLNRLRDIAYPLSQRAWGRERRAARPGSASTAAGMSRYSTKNRAHTRM